MMTKDLDRKVLAETMMGQMDQAGIDNNAAKFDYEGTKAWNNLGNFWSVIGDKSWGGTTTGVKSKGQPERHVVHRDRSGCPRLSPAL
jgi:hypothetical protein